MFACSYPLTTCRWKANARGEGIKHSSVTKFDRVQKLKTLLCWPTPGTLDPLMTLVIPHSFHSSYTKLPIHLVRVLPAGRSSACSRSAKVLFAPRCFDRVGSRRSIQEIPSSSSNSVWWMIQPIRLCVVVRCLTVVLLLGGSGEGTFVVETRYKSRGHFLPKRKIHKQCGCETE